MKVDINNHTLLHLLNYLDEVKIENTINDIKPCNLDISVLGELLIALDKKYNTNHLEKLEDKLESKEYRCTRVEKYPKGTEGYDDLEARQGHYIRADNKKEALKIMQEEFPEENEFTADLYRVWIDGKAKKLYK